MRSFPCAWVCPGGGLDPGETLKQCAVRETREETGVVIEEGDVELVACWESCYPTSADMCTENGALQGHYLVLVMLAKVQGPKAPEVALQYEEADMAVWVPSDRLATLLQLDPDGPDLEAVQAVQTVKAVEAQEAAEAEDSECSKTKTDASPMTTSDTANASPPNVKTTDDTHSDVAVIHKSVRLSPQRLCGIYPNPVGEGITQAFLFCLEQLTEADQSRL